MTFKVIVSDPHEQGGLFDGSFDLVVLGQGTVAAQGAPQELYQSISSAYLAGFFGEYSYIPQGVFGQRELFLLAA